MNTELPLRDKYGHFDLTCGSCGETFGTNLDEDEIQCAYCDARRCPCCGEWLGGES